MVSATLRSVKTGGGDSRVGKVSAVMMVALVKPTTGGGVGECVEDLCRCI